LYPSRRGGNHWARHFVGHPKDCIICVYLCPSVVKIISFNTHRKPSNFVHKNLRKPQQNPPSSTLVNPKNFLGPPPPLPILHPLPVSAPCGGPCSLVAASPRRAVAAGTPGPALHHENYETNPKQFLWILFKCNWFHQFCRFFCPQNEPKKSPIRRVPKILLNPSYPFRVCAGSVSPSPRGRGPG
jgi:hypothetical protein